MFALFPIFSCIIVFVNTSKISTRIVFGSCSKPYLPQPLWSPIISRDPDIWIWTGDIVYHDRPNIKCFKAIYDYLNPYNEINTFHCSRIGFGAIKPTNYHHNFKQQLNHKGYQQLLNNNKTNIIGIWDDHDYAQNNGDYFNPYKSEAKDAVMKFLSIPNNHPMRYRDGIYSFHSYTINQLVIDIYLLDIRWFLNRKRNILFGNQQWTWLQNKIMERVSLKQTNISLFVSGIQILPIYRWSETWNDKSNVDRLKFMDLILEYNVSNPVLVSGDVHWAEQMRYNCYNRDRNEYKPLYEITSSGLTHTWSYTYPAVFWYLFKNISPYFSTDGATIGLIDTLNFGEIEVVHFDGNIESIYLRAYGVDGQLMEIDLIEKQYQQVDKNGRDIVNRHSLNVDKNGEKWICVGYNQPDIWKSKVYLMIELLVLITTLFIICFVMTGGCFGCCCCCCCYIQFTKNMYTKLKRCWKVHSKEPMLKAD